MLKKILPWAALLLVVGALSVALLMQSAPVEQSFHKPNGTEVRFLSVTYGTNQMLVWGSSFRRWLYKVLPGWVKSWSGVSLTPFATTETNVPTFWVLETKPRTDNPTSLNNPPGFNGWVRIVDEYGCEYDPEGWTSGTSSFSSRETFMYNAINIGDPHGKIVGISFYDSPAKTQLLGRFLIPGSKITNLPAAAQQPVTPPKQDGEFSFQLVSLVTGLKSARYAYGRPWNSNLFSQAILRIASNGMAAPNWLPMSVHVTDSRGKNILVRASHWGFKDGDAILNFEGALNPAAGPFKLKFSFTHWTGFSPDELVTVKDVPFPETSQTLSPELKIEANGRRLVLEKLYGAHAERPYNNYQSVQPLVQTRLEPNDLLWKVLLERAVDEEGNEMARWGGGPAGGGKECFAFAPTTKAKMMTLTFAVYHDRHAEFEMMPEAVRADGATRK